MLLHVSQQPPASTTLRARLTAVADAVVTVATPDVAASIDSNNLRGWTDSIRGGHVEDAMREIEIAAPDAINASIVKIQLLLAPIGLSRPRPEAQQKTGWGGAAE